jgi:hypothetical protein
VATKDDDGRQLVTGGLPMTEGRHSPLLGGGADISCAIMVGAVRPGLDHDKTPDSVSLLGIHTREREREPHSQHVCSGNARARR